MNKKERKAAAIKKARQKKTIIISVCVSVVAIVTAALVFLLFPQSKTRVFTDGHQTVTLRRDGTFTAELAHEDREGSYTESKANGTVTVTFIIGGAAVDGSIADGILTLPHEWDDGHGHGTRLRQK
ncbi:MAG: hypothetical protein FWG28_03275 [Clostridiales bacterium]|nr:hypothetical protein [Clostridiales bacterium]